MKNDINIDLNSIKAKLNSIPHFLHRYVVVIFVITVLIIYGFLIWQINELSNIPPNEDKITEEMKVIKRPNIDQATIDKIQQLKDQNIGVQALFKSARDNPFKDN